MYKESRELFKNPDVIKGEDIKIEYKPMNKVLHCLLADLWLGGNCVVFVWWKGIQQGSSSQQPFSTWEGEGQSQSTKNGLILQTCGIHVYTKEKGMFLMINRLIDRLLIIGCSDKASCHQEAWKEVNYQNLRVCFLFSLFVSISFCSSSTLFCTIIFILYRIIIP